MPFTPFHMGPALLVNAVAPRHFSVLVFGVSQVLIDLEPLVRIVRGDRVLHGFTHTIGGAVVIGLAAALTGRPFANWFLAMLRRDVAAPGGPSLLTGSVTWPVAFLSAAIGTGSHLILDGIMHRDMQPFAPIASTNPLLGVIGLGVLHISCVATGAAGILGLILRDANRARRSGAGAR